MSNKPFYSVALQHFNTIKVNLSQVGEKLGGMVKWNIDNGVFKNGCAIRMSYVLNKSGVTIPQIKGKTSSGENKEAWYIYNIGNLRLFLIEKFGRPKTFTPTEARSKLENKKGIVAFGVSGWTDGASGHITLWGGKACVDACYFPDDHINPRLSTHSVEFWELK